MSEPKLCPYREYVEFIVPDDIGTQKTAPKFAPCLQEKCAMWRAGIDPATARNIRAQIGQIDYDIDCVGYCGLAGKP